MPEGLAKVELDIITLALHAHTQQQSSLGVKIKPELSGEIVAKVHGVKLQRGTPDEIMVTKGIIIPNGGDDVKGARYGNIDRLVPPRVEVPHDDSRLGQTLLVLVTQNHVRITIPTGVACFQVLGLYNLDREHILACFPNQGLDAFDPADRLGTAVYVHGLF